MTSDLRPGWIYIHTICSWPDAWRSQSKCSSLFSGDLMHMPHSAIFSLSSDVWYTSSCNMCLYIYFKYLYELTWLSPQSLKAVLFPQHERDCINCIEINRTSSFLLGELYRGGCFLKTSDFSMFKSVSYWHKHLFWLPLLLRHRRS